jgi:hypothetical protein
MTPGNVSLGRTAASSGRAANLSQLVERAH